MARSSARSPPPLLKGASPAGFAPTHLLFKEPHLPYPAFIWDLYTDDVYPLALPSGAGQLRCLCLAPETVTRIDLVRSVCFTSGGFAVCHDSVRQPVVWQHLWEGGLGPGCCAWSPDSQRLAVYQCTRAGETEVFILRFVRGPALLLQHRCSLAAGWQACSQLSFDSIGKHLALCCTRLPSAGSQLSALLVLHAAPLGVMLARSCCYDALFDLEESTDTDPNPWWTANCLSIALSEDARQHQVLDLV